MIGLFSQRFAPYVMHDHASYIVIMIIQLTTARLLIIVPACVILKTHSNVLSGKVAYILYRCSRLGFCRCESCPEFSVILPIRDTV